jgi:hypothetical protein
MVTPMRTLRILSGFALTLLLAIGLSACQKSAQTDMSQTSDTTQVSQGYGNETTPPAATESQPAAGTTAPSDRAVTKSSSKGTTSRSSTSKGTTAMNAESHSIDIPAGTTFDIAMVTPVDTRTSAVGDKVEGKLTAPIVIDGKTVANEGASVSGEVADIQKASRHKGEDDRAFISLAFNTLDTVDGPKALHATVNNAEGKVVAKGTGTRDKLMVAGGAVAGAIAGKAIGGSTKSTIIGAVGGAAAGTGAMLMVKGHELEIEQGAKVSLRVDKPITVVER